MVSQFKVFGSKNCQGDEKLGSYALENIIFRYMNEKPGRHVSSMILWAKWTVPLVKDLLFLLALLGFEQVRTYRRHVWEYNDHYWPRQRITDMFLVAFKQALTVFFQISYENSVLNYLLADVSPSVIDTSEIR